MQAKVKWPATGLIVLGAIGVVLGLLNVLGVGGADPADVDAELANMVETINKFGRAWGALVIVSSAFVVWAGLQMKQLRARGAAIAACIVAMTPLIGCACLLGIPLGIWGLVVLLSAEAKEAFGGGA